MYVLAPLREWRRWLPCKLPVLVLRYAQTVSVGVLETEFEIAPALVPELSYRDAGSLVLVEHCRRILDVDLNGPRPRRTVAGKRRNDNMGGVPDDAHLAGVEFFRMGPPSVRTAEPEFSAVEFLGSFRIHNTQYRYRFFEHAITSNSENGQSPATWMVRFKSGSE